MSNDEGAEPLNMLCFDQQLMLNDEEIKERKKNKGEFRTRNAEFRMMKA